MGSLPGDHRPTPWFQSILKCVAGIALLKHTLPTRPSPPPSCAQGCCPPPHRPHRCPAFPAPVSMGHSLLFSTPSCPPWNRCQCLPPRPGEVKAQSLPVLGWGWYQVRAKWVWFNESLSDPVLHWQGQGPGVPFTYVSVPWFPCFQEGVLGTSPAHCSKQPSGGDTLHQVPWPPDLTCSL